MYKLIFTPMSLLDSAFVFLSSPELGKSLWGGFGFSFALGGAYFMASALFPQYKWTYKAKNTVGVNIPMFSFHTVVGLLFLLGSIVMIYASATDSNGPTADCCFTVLTGSVFTALNLYGFLGNAYIVLLKLLHKNGAKKVGITESEYYEKYVQPKLKVKA